MRKHTLVKNTNIILDHVTELGIEITEEQRLILERDIESVLFSQGNTTKHECAERINKLPTSLLAKTGDKREEKLISNAFRHAENAALLVEIDD